jgi:hypothetical protein
MAPDRPSPYLVVGYDGAPSDVITQVAETRDADAAIDRPRHDGRRG